MTLSDTFDRYIDQLSLVTALYSIYIKQSLMYGPCVFSQLENYIIEIRLCKVMAP